jgi:hypothetical protein
MFLLELVMGFRGIPGNTDYFDTGGIEFSLGLGEPDGLPCATRSVVFRVKIQNEGVALETRGGYFTSAVRFQPEARGTIARREFLGQ